MSTSRDDLKEQSLHMIGNAHLDPVWLWQWQEGFHETKATFRSVLNLMAEYDDFVFTSSSAAIYEWVEHNDPGMFEEIRGRVAEGRWVIAGGWWIQPDCNLPSGESFVRQGLYGQRYFKEKLGVTASVGYNVDSFGHNAMLPQILRKSRMDSYVFMRPQPHEMELPARLFRWESEDGSSVLAFRILFEYCTWGKDLENHIRRCQSELKPPFNEMMCFYGVGNHGGGPTRENLDSIRRLDGAPDFPRLVFNSPNQFFESVRSRDLPFPLVREDLQHHASGCYAAESEVKRLNRLAENRLIAAEKLSALAERVMGQPYPDDFARAWKGVLFNQFHDILAGTSIQPAYDDARDLYGEALAIAGRNLNNAVQSLAWNIRIPAEEGARPIVVFNPHSWDVAANVELEFARVNEDDVLLDDTDKPIPFQRVRSLATVNQGRNRLSFTAELPSLGYRTYRLAPRPGSEQSIAPIEATDRSLESERFRLEIDPETGSVSHLYDKASGFEVFSDRAARTVVIEDTSDTWSHAVLRFDKAIGEFRAKYAKLVEHGPVKSTLRVVSEYGSSTLRQDFTMYPNLDRIDIRVTVDWREQFKMLKLRFPVNVRQPQATYEIPYGFIHRPCNGEEEPGQSWLDLTGQAADLDRTYGLSVLNDGKYSFDVQDSDVGLTVLRSPIYAHHDPYVPDPDTEYDFIDQGTQSFTYSLLPHEGSWEDAGTVRQAAVLNQAPITLIETFHERGKLLPADSYLSTDVDNVIVSAVKQAEDSDDLVLRAYETSGRATEATIKLPRWRREITAWFGRCEIKTFRVPADDAKPVVETNLIEWEDAT